MAQYETSLEGVDLQTTEGCPECVTDDRRRPRRPSQVSPTLVPLLRGNLPADLPPSDETELLDDPAKFAPVVGITIIVSSSVLLWTVIGFAARAMLR